MSKKRTATTPKAAARARASIDDLLLPELFKALSDPTRLFLVACLAKCGRPSSVGELAECTAVDLSVVSRHLAILARAGVLDSTKNGRTVLYEVRYQQLSETLRALADAIDACCPDGAASACRVRCVGHPQTRKKL